MSSARAGVAWLRRLWLRHTGGYQLNMLGLSRPLKDGERFELTLFFEHAGQQTVEVWVQTPRRG